jgi:hypothetical protein
MINLYSKGKVFLYRKQFDDLVDQNKLVRGVEYCIIDKSEFFKETIESREWTEISNPTGNFVYKAVSKNTYSTYSSVDLKGTFVVGNYGIIMHSINSSGNIVFYAMNKPSEDVILDLEVHL